MLSYLGAHLLAILPLTSDGEIDLRGLSLRAIAGGIWSWFLAYAVPLLGHVARTVPITTILLLWTADMIVGTMVAIKRRNWSSKRAKAGVAKLCLLWLPAMACTCLLRDSHAIGAALLAGTVESYVLFVEFGSVLQNLGRLSNHRGIEQAGDAVEDKAEQTLKGLGKGK